MNKLFKLNLLISVATLLAAMYITDFGRKTMYFLSTVLTIFFQISFGIVDYMNIGIQFKVVPILLICCQVFFLQLGLQTFPNLLSSELFPNDARSRCKGLIRAFSAISSAIMLKLFPYAETHIGNYWWLFKYEMKISNSFQVSMGLFGCWQQFCWLLFPLSTCMYLRQKMWIWATLISSLHQYKQSFTWSFHSQIPIFQVSQTLVTESRWYKIVLGQLEEFWIMEQEFSLLRVSC